MVHALEQCLRVLAPEGALVDIRPFLGDMRLEVVTAEESQLAGRVIDAALVPDHRAANDTLTAAVERGALKLEKQHFFDYAYYWDSLAAFQGYIKENWTSRKVPNAAIRGARRLLRQVDSPARIRIRDKRIISRYRKTLL